MAINWNRSIGWNIDNMKVKFKDGTYTWVQPGQGGTKTVGGLAAPPGWEWQKLEITQRIYDGCDCYPWMKTFAFLPRRTISGKIIWLKQYHYGYRLIEGPAGEDPVKLEMRLTPTEYTWFQLANQ